MNIQTVRVRNRIRQMMYAPRKSRVTNRETLKALDEIGRAPDKGPAGPQTKSKRP